MSSLLFILIQTVSTELIWRPSHLFRLLSMYMIGYVLKTSDHEYLFLQLFRNVGECSLVIGILCPWEPKTLEMDGSNKSFLFKADSV